MSSPDPDALNFDRINDALCKATPPIEHMRAVLRTAVCDPGDDSKLDAAFESMTDLQVIVAALETILALVAELSVTHHVSMPAIVERFLVGRDVSSVANIFAL